MMKRGFLAGALAVGLALAAAPGGAYAQSATSTGATAAEAGGNPGTLPMKKPAVRRRAKPTVAAATASPANKSADGKGPPVNRTDAGAALR